MNWKVELNNGWRVLVEIPNHMVLDEAYMKRITRVCLQPNIVITCEYRVNEIKIWYCISKKLCKFELVFQCWSSSCACQLIIASSKKRIAQIQHAVKKLTWWMLPETWFLWMPRTWIFGREQQHISVYDLNFVIEFKIATKLKNEKKWQEDEK